MRPFQVKLAEILETPIVDNSYLPARNLPNNSKEIQMISTHTD
jgi:hypothetical protein